MRAAQIFQNKPTDHARGITKLGLPQPPHYPIGVKRVHVNSPNVEGTVFQTFLKLQATFLYSIYHHRAGKTNYLKISYERGVDFTLGICYVPLRMFDAFTYKMV